MFSNLQIQVSKIYNYSILPTAHGHFKKSYWPFCNTLNVTR